MGRTLNIINVEVDLGAGVFKDNPGEYDDKLKVAVEQDSTASPEEIKALKNKIKEQLPNSRQPDEKQVEERRKLQQKALETVKATTHRNYGSVKAYDEMGAHKRDLTRLLLPTEGNEQNAVKNDATVKAITSGTPAEKHQILLDIMQQMASVPVDKFSNPGDEELVDLFDAHFREIMIGYEGENILATLQRFGCPVSEDEKKQFTALSRQLNDICTTITARMDEIMSPFYPETDISGLTLDRVDEREEVVQTAENISLAADALLKAHNDFIGAQYVDYDARFQRIFDSHGELTANGNMYLTDSPTILTEEERGEDETNKYLTGGFLKDLKAGKPVYGYISTNGNPSQIRVFQDLNGDGVIREVPMPVKKPGFLANLWDGIKKLFGSQEGYAPCRAWESYSAEIETIKNTPAESTVAEKFHEAAQFTEKAIEDEKAVENELKVLEKDEKQVDSIVEEADEIIDGMMGPEASGSDILLKGHHYDEKDYVPDKLEFPKNTGFTDHQLGVIAMCCLSDPSIWENYSKKNSFLTNEENARHFFTNSTTDIFVTKRSSIRQSLEVMNPARENAIEYLKAFAENKPEQLGKVLGLAFKNFNTSLNGRPDITHETIACTALQKEILEIINKTPELKQASGLTEDDITLYRANQFRAKAFEKSLTANKKLMQSAVNCEELSPEKKEDLLADISLHRTLEGLNKYAINHVENSKEYSNATDKLMQVARSGAELSTKLRSGKKNNTLNEAEIENLNKEISLKNEENDAIADKQRFLIASRPLSPMDRILAMNNSTKVTENAIKDVLKSQTAFKVMTTKTTKELAVSSAGSVEFGHEREFVERLLENPVKKNPEPTVKNPGLVINNPVRQKEAVLG